MVDCGWRVDEEQADTVRFVVEFCNPNEVDVSVIPVKR